MQPRASCMSPPADLAGAVGRPAAWRASRSPAIPKQQGARACSLLWVLSREAGPAPCNARIPRLPRGRRPPRSRSAPLSCACRALRVTRRRRPDARADARPGLWRGVTTPGARPPGLPLGRVAGAMPRTALCRPIRARFDWRLTVPLACGCEHLGEEEGGVDAFVARYWPGLSRVRRRERSSAGCPGGAAQEICVQSDCFGAGCDAQLVA